MGLERRELHHSELIPPEGDEQQRRVAAKLQMRVDEARDRPATETTQPAEAEHRAGNRPPTGEADPGHDTDRLFGGGRPDVSYDHGMPSVRTIVTESNPRTATAASRTRAAACRRPNPGDIADDALRFCATTAPASATARPSP